MNECEVKVVCKLEYMIPFELVRTVCAHDLIHAEQLVLRDLVCENPGSCEADYEVQSINLRQVNNHVL
jgi:hypothetical protein